MYGREVQGQQLTFGVSGSPIMNALVMYDRETDSLWSQFLGVGVRGPHAGVKLDLLGSTLTTWQAWRDAHPDTVVLDQGRRRVDSYNGYYASGSAGVRGETNVDDRLGTKEFVLGLQLDGAQKAYPFRYLSETPVVNDSVGGLSIVVAFDATIATGKIYERTVDGRTLTFDTAPATGGDAAAIVDRETGTRWSRLTGEALGGPLAGTRLVEVPALPAFWFAWSDFHPQSAFMEPPSVG